MNGEEPDSTGEELDVETGSTSAVMCER